MLAQELSCFVDVPVNVAPSSEVSINTEGAP